MQMYAFLPVVSVTFCVIPSLHGSHVVTRTVRVTNKCIIITAIPEGLYCQVSVAFNGDGWLGLSGDVASSQGNVTKWGVGLKKIIVKYMKCHR